MEYWWKENKRFALIVGGIALAVLLFNGFILSPIRAKRAKLQAELEFDTMNYLLITAKGVPADDSLKRAESDEDRARKQLQGLVEELGLNVSEEYAVKGGRDSVREKWDNLKLDVYKKLREQAVNHKVGFPDALGYDGAETDAPEFIDRVCRELLLRLGITERLCNAAVNSGVDKITAIDMVYGIDPKDEPAMKPGRFLNKLQVQIKLTGSSESVFRLLHALQRRGEYLAIDGFAFVRQSGQDLFDTEIVVSGLVIDPKGAIVVQEEPQP